MHTQIFLDRRLPQSPPKSGRQKRRRLRRTRLRLAEGGRVHEFFGPEMMWILQAGIPINFEQGTLEEYQDANYSLL